MDINKEQKIKNAIVELSNSFLRTESERDLQKEIIKKLNDDTDIDKKVIRKMARTYHKQNYHEEHQANEEFSDLYETVFNKSFSEMDDMD